MSKGSKRRREDRAAVEANWDSIFGQAKDIEACDTGARAALTEHQPRELEVRQDHSAEGLRQ